MVTTSGVLEQPAAKKEKGRISNKKSLVRFIEDSLLSLLDIAKKEREK